LLLFVRGVDLMGSIINVASQRGLKDAVNSMPYSATKASIMGFTRALVWEATPKGVRVDAISALPDRHRPDRNHDARRSPSLHRCALQVGHFCRPEEIAATTLLLGGPDGGFYVGAILSPNGGDVMHLTVHALPSAVREVSEVPEVSEKELGSPSRLHPLSVGPHCEFRQLRQLRYRNCPSPRAGARKERQRGTQRNRPIL
jgi:Enoyl-(Acyl carrier protein) reductase